MITIHPGRLVGSHIQPDRDFVVAVLHLGPQGERCQVYLPDLQASLDDLFARDWVIEGQDYPAWSARAIEHILRVELPRLQLYACFPPD